MLRKSFLIIGAMFLLVSCSSEPKKEAQKGPSTGEVVDKYVDTLTGARPKATKAAEAENRRVEEQNKMIKELDK